MRDSEATRRLFPAAAPGRMTRSVTWAALAAVLVVAGCSDDAPPPQDAADGAPAPDGHAGDAGPPPDSRPGDTIPRPDQASGPCGRPVSVPPKYRPGETYWGRNNYIRYTAGNLPIVISAPHGGTLMPGEIPDRSYGVLGKDTNSQEYALEVARDLERLTGRRPHLIINRLHRKKLDANREIVEAAQGNKWAEQAWTEFHEFIGGARAWVTARCGQGHYFDFHTNGHADQWVELGFLLWASDLQLPDATLDQSTYVNKSSLKALASKPGVSLANVVRGPVSIGALLTAQGYKAVPGPLNPSPAGGGYFSGGYNTARHGSKTGGTVDGTQVETYTKFINTESGRADYAAKLSLSINAFVEHHYKISLAAAAWSPPANGVCTGAAPLSLAAGAAAVKGSTSGASNEFGTQITCGNTFALDGPQVYYSVQLQAGASYDLTLVADFPARIYMFGDTCSPAAISAQCQQSGLSGVLVSLNVSKTATVTPTKTGKHIIAVDSRADPWHGSFVLSVKKK